MSEESAPDTDTTDDPQVFTKSCSVHGLTFMKLDDLCHWGEGLGGCQEPLVDLPPMIPMEQLQQTFNTMKIEFKGRTGRPLPMSTIRFDALVDFVFNPGTPERETFERYAIAKGIEFASTVLTEARKNSLKI